MLYLNDIKVEFESQGFKGTHIGISPQKDKTVLFLESVKSTQSVRCPYCSGSVYIYENGQVNLKDIPLWKGTTHLWNFFIHRYKCNQCQETFTEEIPFKYPGTRITYRAANWIKGFLQQKMSIKAIQELTGIHWDTIRKVQREIMDTAIWEREKALREEGYKPRILAVDEFAIHKGHSYATCVMDLEQGDVLWVGKGRAMKDFEKFFEDMPADSLSAVIAVAMDMNASYNKLVTKHLPTAQIIYDRFHMQAQFGKQLYGIYAQGSYRLPVSYFNFYFNGKVMYNRYNLTRTNEYVMNLSVLMETPYFELQVGESGIRYHMLHSSYNEPMTFTFGTGVNIRPRWNSWNIGLYFRNFDEFYYENWNINWGVRFNAKLTQQLNLFGEFKVRPAGSLSQLASKYETSEKIGVKYVW